MTRLLMRLRDGDDRDAFNELVPLVYRDLRRIAHLQLRRLRQGQTLDTTGLVNEAYVKLVDRSADWKDKAHFFAVAATAMRTILIDRARYLTRQKRGGQENPLPLDEHMRLLAADAREMIDLDRALEELAQIDHRLVRVVECRYFGGLTSEEIGTALNISMRTVERDWLKAKAWLRQRLSADGDD